MTRYFTWDQPCGLSLTHYVVRVEKRWYADVVVTRCGKEPFRRFGEFLRLRRLCRLCLRSGGTDSAKPLPTKGVSDG